MADTKTMIDWKSEDTYWRREFKNRPYTGSHEYDYWQPAYQYGFEAADRYHGKKWNEVESDLRMGWDKWDKYPANRTRSTWEHVKDAVRDAWNRVVH